MLRTGYKPTVAKTAKLPALKTGAWPRTITFSGPKRKVTKISKLTGSKRTR